MNIDTAYIYEGSEEATKAALCDRYPRESYYLADKLNGSDFAAKSEEEAKNEIRVSLERTGAGYIEFHLIPQGGIIFAPLSLEHFRSKPQKYIKYDENGHIFSLGCSY